MTTLNSKSVTCLHLIIVKDRMAASAAQLALQQLDDHLTCAICFEPFTKPKILHCAHVFCEKCLVVKPVGTGRGRKVITCPVCAQDTPLPPAGVAYLQNAFYLNSLTEIRGTLENAGDPTPSAPVRQDLMPSANVNICLLHGKELEFLCKSCDILICAHCIVEQHQSHEFVLKDEEARKFQTQLRFLQATLDSSTQLIVNQRASLEANIDLIIEASVQEVRLKKTNLIDKLYRNAEEKLQCLCAIKKQITGELKELEASNQVDKAKAQITAYMNQVSKLKCEASLIDLYEMIRNDCKHKIYASGVEFTNSQVGETSTMVLHKIDDGDWPTLQCQVIPEDAHDDDVVCDVTLISDHQCEITFVPKIKGLYKFHIKADKSHIIGSPFPLLATLPVEQIRAPVMIMSGVTSPFGIAVNMHGDIVVAEYSRHRVAIYNNGKVVCSFGSHGSGYGEFIKPRGVAVDWNGNIFVSDEGNNRLQKFSCKGVFMRSVGNEGKGPLEFSTPTGIACNPCDQKLYVADMGNCRVQVLNSDLSFSHFIGAKDADQGKLAYPWDVTFDHSGYVYVADTSNDRIQVFTAKGHFLHSIKGQGKGEFARPTSVAIDEDVLYLSDLKNHKIVAYTTDGDFKASFGQFGGESGGFNLPHGLAVDKGMIYVSDLGNRRIQVF